MGLETNALFVLLRDYFKQYLPKVKKCSPNTIRSYQKAMELFLDFVKEAKGLKLYEITFDVIDKATVTAFLDYIEHKRGCSLVTRNHRMQCIRAFYKYAAACNLGAVAYWNELKTIRIARTAEKPIGYMSEAAVEAVLTQPNMATQKGLRDTFLMLFLYQTGARVQELLDVRLSDISLGSAAVVTLRGKGSKVRCVPLRDKLVRHLNRYLAVFHPNAEKYSDRYLFFVARSGEQKRMTEDNVRRLVRKYGEMARKQLPEVPENIHPHLFRHSRAMHLYQNGVSLPLVSQWLGHSRLETTLIYAYADTEQKRRAIEKAIPEESTLKEYLNATRYQLDDEETIKRLYGLR